VCGEARCGVRSECKYDRGEYCFVGVLLHGVETVDVFVNETEVACAVGHEGRVAEFEPDVYGCKFGPIIGMCWWYRDN
jgi:hypothetical protein